MAKFDAILWDCDGVLVNSEAISCAVFCEVLNKAGISITIDQFYSQYTGKSLSKIYAELTEKHGIDLQKAIDDEQRQALLYDRFRQELKAIPDVIPFLEQHKEIPMAVASGSLIKRLFLGLEVTQLDRFFGDHIYSAELVEHGKPAPDIFLYAANKLDVSASKCLVIEDSENGVRAGKAAGATVFGFTGGSHIPDKQKHADTLTSLGADLIFHDMKNLPKLII